jgi:hypothetical protein
MECILVCIVVPVAERVRTPPPTPKIERLAWGHGHPVMLLAWQTEVTLSPDAEFGKTAGVERESEARLDDVSFLRR